MKRSGFTIIEIAMILCVVALAIGGIVAVQEFHKTSGVRGLAAQIAKYDHAIAAFQEKYKGLPGDLRDTVKDGFSNESTDGDNNGIITNRTLDLSQANGEISNFWMHLSKSKLLDEEYDGAENEFVRFGKTFPTSELGESTGIIVYGADGKNFYQVGFKFTSIDRLYMSNRSITGENAFLFDKKIDDGNAEKGRVTAAGSDQLNFPANVICEKDGKYNREAESPFCQLRIELRK